MFAFFFSLLHIFDCQTEVSNLCIEVLIQEDVCRLEISMNETKGVKVLQPINDLSNKPVSHSIFHYPIKVNDVSQALSLTVLHLNEELFLDLCFRRRPHKFLCHLTDVFTHCSFSKF
jgi:hypothetical protein